MQDPAHVLCVALQGTCNVGAAIDSLRAMLYWRKSSTQTSSETSVVSFPCIELIPVVLESVHTRLNDSSHDIIMSYRNCD